MKSNCTLAIFLAAALLTSSATSLWADDWKTTAGKVYQDVKVIEATPDAVTILHKDGGASVPLANLPPDIQKRFNYDPVKAKAAADARVQNDAANAKDLQVEMDQASQMRQAGPEPQDTNAPETTSSTAHHADATCTKTASTNATQHSVDELSSSTLSLKSDPSDATHHSIDDLSAPTLSLRRNLSDPTYHTTAHLTYMINSQGLGPDPSDPNHHIMSDITDSGL
jgi:hypothetical protein